MAYYPVYADLATFSNDGGTYTFQPHHSYLAERPMALRRPRTALLGRRVPADSLVGGVGTYDRMQATFVYWIVAPPGTPLAAAPALVDAEYQALIALRDSTNGDGSGGEIGTLTITDPSGTAHSCTAALLDAPIRADARGPYHLKINIIFELYSEFDGDAGGVGSITPVG